ncbi:MAG TPA: (Fe-S)-binding protein [Polyangiaceae bacterium]|nr:(Fe-S)-binding protein [Polyangiaceae bacterium]
MRALPVLEARRDALEKCVFCPKLCRSTCPVSNAEPRETITPWGKMSGAWMAAHGDVPLDAVHAASAWACSGCWHCRAGCDHRNPVADVLLDARAALARRGLAPPAARRVIDRFPQHDAATQDSTRALMNHPRARPGGADALLIGCSYTRRLPEEAFDAVSATTALTGRPVELVRRCCGLPLLLAGDAEGFARQVATVARSVAGAARILVVDAGCASTLRRHYRGAADYVAARTQVLVELAAERVSGLAAVGDLGGLVRWHDPCQLGRVLGLYDAPRAVLGRILGRPPDELLDVREHAICAGSGGLLPSTMPDVARSIAAARVAAHDQAGGGRIVTACASSLLLLRRAGAGSHVPVDDLVTWIARASQGDPLSGRSGA